MARHDSILLVAGLRLKRRIAKSTRCRFADASCGVRTQTPYNALCSSADLVIFSITHPSDSFILVGFFQL